MTSDKWRPESYVRLAQMLPEELDAYLKTIEDCWIDFRPLLQDGSLGPVVMRSMRLGELDPGWNAILHEFVAVEPLEPSHTHQADLSFRAVLRGGYDELVTMADGRAIRQRWRAGDCGFIPSEFDHKVVSIEPGGAITLFIRGPTRNSVRWTFPSGAVRILAIDEMD